MIKKITTYLFFPLLLAVCVLNFAGCTDDTDELGINAGFVQFKLYKSGDNSRASLKAAELPYLNDAKKIEITLDYNHTTIKQTLNLSAYNPENAEYGLTSDKLELLAGDYTIVGYRLFDAVDREILEGFVVESAFKVELGGLVVKSFPVNVVKRGKVRFNLVKDLPAATTMAKAAAAEQPTYLFSNVAKADITVRNTFTKEETSFKKIPFVYSTFVEGTVGNTTVSASAKADSIVSLKAGTYEVIKYTVYNRYGTWLGENNAPAKSTFTVNDNEVAEAEAKITISEEAEYIKDYKALKAIWTALNGPKWSYFGQSYPQGINWNFDKDIDMWGNQPGVVLNSQGRVVSLFIGEFGPAGAMPEELGQLTELNMMSLGTHNDKVGVLSPQFASMSTKQVMDSRSHYADLFLKRDVRSSFAKEIVQGYKNFKGVEFGSKTPLVNKSNNGPVLFDVLPGDITNKITSLPQSIGNLKKLTHLYIANGWISELPATMSEMVSLTDLEIYNCPKMTKYPDALNTIPNLVALNIARNIQIPSSEIYRGLNEFATSSPSRGTIQMFYAGFNNLEVMPASFKNLVSIGLFDLSHNKLKGALTPLTSSVQPVQIFLNNNQITSVPDNFCNIDDIEFILLNDNKLTKVPNLFDASSPYTIDAIDLSFNEIDGFNPVGYKGMKVSVLNLSGNKLTEFPNILYNQTAFNSGSTIGMLNISGNQISKFDSEGFHGPKLFMTESFDMSNNNLTELPADFNASKLPYLYGLDLSGNSFTNFPYGPLNVSRLTIMLIRNQRNAEGVRTLRTWPTGLYTCPSLRAFYIGGNDLRKIDDTISYMIYIFEIIDNPNISIDVSDVCPYIKAGRYQLIYNRTQDIRGCDALNIVN